LYGDVRTQPGSQSGDFFGQGIQVGLLGEQFEALQPFIDRDGGCFGEADVAGEATVIVWVRVRVTAANLADGGLDVWENQQAGRSGFADIEHALALNGRDIVNGEDNHANVVFGDNGRDIIAPAQDFKAVNAGALFEEVIINQANGTDETGLKRVGE